MLQIGNTLRRLRNKKGLTQKEVADELHISYQTISKWELDKSLPSLEMMVALSQLYQVSIDQIVANKTTGLLRFSNILSVFPKKKEGIQMKKNSINFSQQLMKDGALRTDILIEGTLFPSKKTNVTKFMYLFYPKRDWLCAFEEQGVVVTNVHTAHVTQIDQKEISKIAFSIAKSNFEAMPGYFSSLSQVITEIKLFFKEDRPCMTLLCSSYQVVPKLVDYCSAHGISVEDSLGMSDFIKKTPKEEVNEYFYLHYRELLEKHGLSEEDKLYLLIDKK